MTQKTYTIRASKAFSVLFFTTACGLAACAPEDDDNTGTYQPPNGGLMQDASAAVTGDAGTITPIVQTTPDASGAGTASTGSDAGLKPVVTADAGPVVTTDAGPVVTPEGGAPDSGDAMRADLGMGDGKDVVCIGDSWMSYSGTEGIEYSLEKASKRTYRKYGVSGTKLLDEVIPKQYDKAKSEGVIKTVVMTGGGNDIIQEKPLDCEDGSFGKVCTDQIDKVGARLVSLWDQMSKDGVQDVVLVGYTTKASLVILSLKKSAEYSNMKIPPLCAAVPPPLRCHVVDSDMVAPDLALRDGIHPDGAGYDKIGAAVWKLMQDKGMRR